MFIFGWKVPEVFQSWLWFVDCVDVTISLASIDGVDRTSTIWEKKRGSTGRLHAWQQGERSSRGHETLCLQPPPPHLLTYQRQIANKRGGAWSTQCHSPFSERLNTSEFCHHDYFSVFTFEFGRKSHLQHFVRRTPQRVYMSTGH